MELEVGENAEKAALSGRTACSGAFCASKQHQSIMSSIQRHIGGAIRHTPGQAGVLQGLLATAKSFLQTVFNAARAPSSALRMAFASRHPTSPLYITLQDKVLPEHSDASSYALLNTGYKMTTGLQ